MKVNGIKNINQEITLNFYNQTLKNTFDLNKSNIKAIYGKNGSGKSAIMNAIEIYKDLVTDDDYLSNFKTTNLLNELINKQLNKLNLEMTYLFYTKIDKQRTYAYTHQIELSKNKNDRFYISHELLFKNKGTKYDMSKGLIIVETLNGELINQNLGENAKEFIKLSNNLYSKSSLPTLLINLFNSYEDKTDPFENNQSYVDLFSPIALINNLKIVLDIKDTHKDYFIDKYINENINIETHFLIKHFYDEYITKSNNKLNDTIDYIFKDNYDNYANNVKQLEKFIQVFKPSLQEILIDKIEDKDVYVCRKILKYKDYQIDSEFESTGIKKLITYYNAFRDFNNGMIVFIDELDANLHDVYLCKLLEYFSKYGKGQLCFTTHNLAPMEILKKRNYSIDFLSDNSQITSWTKNGNYSVSKLYKEGMIENSPFNVEDFSFLGLFEE